MNQLQSPLAPNQTQMTRGRHTLVGGKRIGGNIAVGNLTKINAPSQLKIAILIIDVHTVEGRIIVSIIVGNGRVRARMVHHEGNHLEMGNPAQ